MYNDIENICKNIINMSKKIKTNDIIKSVSYDEVVDFTDIEEDLSYDDVEYKAENTIKNRYRQDLLLKELLAPRLRQTTINEYFN